MSKLMVLPIAVLMVSACSTPADLRTKSPTLEVTSKNSAKVVAGCIADGWEAHSNSTKILNTRPTSKGFSVSRDDDMGLYGRTTGLVADIEDSDTGSATRFYNELVIGGGVFTKVVRDCQGAVSMDSKVEKANSNSQLTSHPDSLSQKLRELQALRNDGVITEVEFQNKKKQLLEKFN